MAAMSSNMSRDAFVKSSIVSHILKTCQGVLL